MSFTLIDKNTGKILLKDIETLDMVIERRINKMKKQGLEEKAPEGQIWVCTACGKFNEDRYKVGDVSCYINSMLFYKKHLKFKDGRVVEVCEEIPVGEKK